MITSAEVTDALVEKLKAAGYDINPETATSAEVLELLNIAEIRKPKFYAAVITEDHADRNVLSCGVFTCDPTVAMRLYSTSKPNLQRMIQFVTDACNRYLP